MRKEKKQVLIDEIRSIFKGYEVVIIINLSGIDGNQVKEFRSDLWNGEADMKVVKNSLLRIVLAEESLSDVEQFSNEAAILYSNDVVSLSKLISGFIKDNAGKATVINMIYDSMLFCSERVKKFASLPDLTTLYGSLIALLNQSRGGGLINLLNTPKSQLFNLVKVRVND